MAGAAVFAIALFGLGLFMLAHGIGPAAKMTDHAPDTSNPETTAQGSQPIYQSQCEFSSTAPRGAVCTFLARDPGGGASQASFQGQALEIDVPASWLRQQAGGTAPNNAAVIAALVQTPYYPAGSGAVADMTLSVDPAYGALLQAAGVDPRRLLGWLYQQVPSNRWPPWVAGG